jgi:hypothetical protein
MMSDDPFGICADPECGDDEPPKDLPSFKDMVKSLAGATNDVVRGMLGGDGLLVTEDIYIERINICNSCPFFRKEDKRCTKCGCFMEAKTRLKKTYCPVNKWEAII